MKILRCLKLHGFLSSFIPPSGLHTLPVFLLIHSLTASELLQSREQSTSSKVGLLNIQDALFLLIEIGPKMSHFPGILFRMIRGADSAVALTRVNMEPHCPQAQVELHIIVDINFFGLQTRKFILFNLIFPRIGQCVALSSLIPRIFNLQTCRRYGILLIFSLPALDSSCLAIRSQKVGSSECVSLCTDSSTRLDRGPSWRL